MYSMFVPNKIVINNEEEYLQITWSDGKYFNTHFLGYDEIAHA